MVDREPISDIIYLNLSEDHEMKPYISVTNVGDGRVELRMGINGESVALALTNDAFCEMTKAFNADRARRNRARLLV